MQIRLARPIIAQISFDENEISGKNKPMMTIYDLYEYDSILYYSLFYSC